MRRFLLVLLFSLDCLFVHARTVMLVNGSATYAASVDIVDASNNVIAYLVCPKLGASPVVELPAAAGGFNTYCIDGLGASSAAVSVTMTPGKSYIIRQHGNATTTTGHVTYYPTDDTEDTASAAWVTFALLFAAICAYYLRAGWKDGAP